MRTRDETNLANVVHFYTDGACSGNPGPGGWGVVCKRGGAHTELQGYEAATTNNRMELLACIKALESLGAGATGDVHVTTDSRYVKDGITRWIAQWKANGWRTRAKKPVKNQDLWQRLDALHTRHRVAWHWVKGHGGHRENTRADRLATQACKQQLDAVGG